LRAFGLTNALQNHEWVLTLEAGLMVLHLVALDAVGLFAGLTDALVHGGSEVAELADCAVLTVVL